MIDQSVLTAISTIGFPIVAFLLMYAQANKSIAANTKAINELVVFLKGKQ